MIGNCECNPEKMGLKGKIVDKFHCGCSHYGSGKCRLFNYKEPCCMESYDYCYKCCKILKHLNGLARNKAKLNATKLFIKIEEFKGLNPNLDKLIMEFKQTMEKFENNPKLN